MNFRLSPETKQLLVQRTNSKHAKSKINPNSQEFYKKHPDLAPRNVYLATGRVLKFDTVQKHLDKITREPLMERVSNWFKKICKKIIKKGEK